MKVELLGQIGKENMEQINYNELDKKANIGAFSTFDAEVLVPEVKKLSSGEAYVEVGTDRGKSLSIAKMVAPEGVHVWGVDIQENPQVPGTGFLHGDSVAMAKLWDQKLPIGVLFIDGDHSYEGCKRDIDAWFPLVKKNGVMLFHDCDETSPGVIQAVAEFVNNYQGELKEFTLCKRQDKNTSMALIRL